MKQACFAVVAPAGEEAERSLMTLVAISVGQGPSLLLFQFLLHLAVVERSNSALEPGAPTCSST